MASVMLRTQWPQVMSGTEKVDIADSFDKNNGVSLRLATGARSSAVFFKTGLATSNGSDQTRDCPAIEAGCWPDPGLIPCFRQRHRRRWSAFVCPAGQRSWNWCGHGACSPGTTASRGHPEKLFRLARLYQSLYPSWRV